MALYYLFITMRMKTITFNFDFNNKALIETLTAAVKKKPLNITRLNFISAVNNATIYNKVL